jgi:dihydrolipoamide dehydrogenase
LAIPGKIDSLRPDGQGLVARITSGGQTIEHRADALLMAAGRSAAVGDLGLEHLGLELKDGRLEHDEQMQTARPGVYVAGDTTGDRQILHLSNQEGRAAGHNAAGGTPPRTVDYRLPMQVIFTDPPYAQVGLTEAGAERQGIDVVIGRARLAETGRAITMEAGHGVWTLLADRVGGRIVGSSILGPRADDLVHLVSVMMRYGATVEELFELPWYHPTLSEVMLDLLRDLEPQLT